MSYDLLSNEELEQKSIDTINYFLCDKYKNKRSHLINKILSRFFNVDENENKFNYKVILAAVTGAFMIQTAFAVVEENKILKQQVSVFQEKYESNLPQEYPNKEYLFNTDFTKPLPSINLTNDFSCLPYLEAPPTLVESWEPCYTPDIQAQFDKDQAIEDLANKIMGGFIKAEEKQFVRFNLNEYAVVLNKK